MFSSASSKWCQTKLCSDWYFYVCRPQHCTPPARQAARVPVPRGGGKSWPASEKYLVGHPVPAQTARPSDHTGASVNIYQWYDYETRTVQYSPDSNFTSKNWEETLCLYENVLLCSKNLKFDFKFLKLNLLNLLTFFTIFSNLGAMGAAISSHSDLAKNDHLHRLVSKEVLSPSDPFWNSLLSFNFMQPRSK